MSDVVDLLAREAELVAEFIAALSDEQRALSQGDIDPLAAINARKSALAEKLNTLEAERDATLAAGGFEAGRSGMARWLASHDRESSAAAQWGQLLKLAAEARNLNNLNGQLIALRLQATGEAIATLTARAEQNALYGPDGQAAQITGSRIIDAA